MSSTAKSLIVLLGCAAIASCAPSPLPRETALTAPAVVKVRSGGRVLSVPIEDYVLGSALSEVSPVGETPATVGRIFELQTILARTYAFAHLGRHAQEGFDLCDGTHCQ